MHDSTAHHCKTNSRLSINEIAPRAGFSRSRSLQRFARTGSETMQVHVSMQPQRVCERQSWKMDRGLRRALRIAGGFVLLAVGVVMLVTPGPGVIAVAAGIG